MNRVRSLAALKPVGGRRLITSAASLDQVVLRAYHQQHALPMPERDHLRLPVVVPSGTSVQSSLDHVASGWAYLPHGVSFTYNHVANTVPW